MGTQKQAKKVNVIIYATLYIFVHNGVFNLDIGHIPSRSRSNFFGVKYADRDLGLIGIVTKKCSNSNKIAFKRMY